MKYYFLLFLFCLSGIFVPFGLCAQQDSSINSQINDRIQKVESNLAGDIITQYDSIWTLEERMSFYGTPAVSIAVINDFKVEWAKAYGFADIEENRPATTRTLFQAASVSKSLNALGVLKLVGNQEIDLEEDINAYLTSWQFPYDSIAKGKKITVANLLSHSAGLTVHGFSGYQVDASVPNLYQIINGKKPANTKAIRSQFAPGIRFQYSGGGTTLSQLIVEEITGLPYDQYMEKNILIPLKMENSFYTQPPKPNKHSTLATAYRADGSPIKGKFHIYPEQAAAGLWTNPSELANFIIETQLSLLGKSNKIISEEMTKQMVSPYLKSQTTAGLGVFAQKKGKLDFFEHGGANEGFRCRYLGTKDLGKGVVVMVNSDNGQIVGEIINSVAKVYNWEGFYQPEVKEIIDVPIEKLETFTGKYEMGPGYLVKIDREGKLLKAMPPGAPPMLLYPEEENIFFIREMKAKVAFVPGEDQNTITHILLHRGSNQIKAQKVK